MATAAQMLKATTKAPEKVATPEEVEAKYYKEPPSEVHIVMMVALKIVRHCKTNTLPPVTGQLLGLEIGSVLHVTNSFPLPPKVEGDDGADDGWSDKYTAEMLALLGEVNVDTNAIGWYQSTFLGIHLNKFLIDTQFGYQYDTPESVFITYDPLSAGHGSLGLKAYRLGDKFMKLRKDNTFTKEKLAEYNFSFTEIFSEVPVRITNSGLGEGFVASTWQDKSIDDRFEHFDVATGDFVQKNLEILSYCFADYQKEQTNYFNWHRALTKLEQQQQVYIQNRKSSNIAKIEAGEMPLSEDIRDLEVENPSLFRRPTEPSQLETLLVANRINTHCDQVVNYASRLVSKQYALKGLDEAGGI